MAISYVSSTDLIVAANHPYYQDIRNAAGQYINTQMLVAHTADGQHLDRQKAMCGEIGSFTGNGAARTISLTNTNLTPKCVEVWELQTRGELVVNGGFASDTSSWATTGTCTLASIAGGVSGNCCEITTTGTNLGGAAQTLSLIPGRTYNITVYVKSGSSGNGSYTITEAGTVVFSGTTSGSWVERTGSFQAAFAATDLNLLKLDATAGTMLFDSVSVTEVSAAQYIRLSNFDSGKSCLRRSGTMLTTGIGNFAKGSFAIPASSGINTSGVTNYYSVLGYDIDTLPVGDSGAGSDPTWIVHGATLYGDGVGGGSGSSVEKHIEDAFLHEHTDAGAHNPNPYTGFGRIEVGTYTGNGADDRTIILTDTALIIKELLIIPNGGVAGTKTSSMAGDTTKIEWTAALQADVIQSLSTGQFQIGTGANTGSAVFYYMAIGTI